MFKDPSFVITFQLAIIGVVLIGGLFLIWKAMARIEEKIDLLMFEKDGKNMQLFREQLANAFGEEPTRMPEVFQENKDLITPSSTDQAEEIMNMKGPMDQFVMFTATCPFPMAEESASPAEPTVKIEEQHSPPPPPSDGEISLEPLSKNKLRTMNVDKLKKICEEKGLSGEGTKNQLIERILAE